MKPRINQLLKIYQKSWSKAEKAKAMQNKYRRTNKELSDAYGNKAAYYAIQWLHLKNTLVLFK